MSNNQTLAARLRNWAISTDAIPASDLMDEAASEIDRLRLTDAEREAVETAAWAYGIAKAHPEWQALSATMRGLLERTK